MLGCDAKGLEARMEAHHCYTYPGGIEYAEAMLGDKDNDVHVQNAKLWGLYKPDGSVDRSAAKSPKYALTYGAQPPKLAETMGIYTNEAREYFNKFWEGNTALSGFRDDTLEEWRCSNHTLLGLDGRLLKSRSAHSLVNLKFQSSGSIIVKWATVKLIEDIKRRKLDAQMVIHYHDEFQFEVGEKDVEKVKELALKAFTDAGLWYKMNVPIEGDVKIGRSWKETH